MTYLVCVPNQRSHTLRKFTALRDAKRYALELPVGGTVDDRAIIVDAAYKSRYARVQADCTIDYSMCPPTWRSG